MLRLHYNHTTKNHALVGVVFYSIGDPLETRYIFAVGKNYGVAAVQPAASNTPPECCYEFFESPSTSEQNKNHAVVGVVFSLLVTRWGLEPQTHCLKGNCSTD